MDLSLSIKMTLKKFLRKNPKTILIHKNVKLFVMNTIKGAFRLEKFGLFWSIFAPVWGPNRPCTYIRESHLIHSAWLIRPPDLDQECLKSCQAAKSSLSRSFWPVKLKNYLRKIFKNFWSIWILITVFLKNCISWELIGLNRLE